MDEQPLPGGFATTVVRAGNTVRRSARNWVTSHRAELAARLR